MQRKKIRIIVNGFKSLYFTIKKICQKLLFLFKSLFISEKENISDKENLNYWSQSLFIALSFFITFLCGPLFLYGSVLFFEEGNLLFASLETVAYIFMIVIIYNKKINIEIRKFIIIIMLYFFSVLLLIATANAGAGMICILALMFLSGILLEIKRLLYFVLINVVSFTVLTILLMNGQFNGTAMEAYKGIWLINMLTAQICGIGLLFLTHIIYKALEKQAETTKISKDLIEKSEKRYRMIFNHAALGIYNISTDGKFLDANKKFCEIVGYNLEELKKMTFSDITYKEDLTSSKDILSKLVSGESESIYAEKRYIGKDGNIIQAEISATMLRTDNNEPLYSVTTVNDITEKKRIEQNYQSIIKTAMNGFWLIDKNGRFIEVNDKYCTLTGYSRDELLKMSIADIEVLENQTQITRRLEKIIKKGSQRFITKHKHKNGQHIYVEINADYIPESNDKLAVFIRDLTSQMELEQNKLLLETKLREQQKLESIGVLASGVAHEINNPINGIMNYAQLIMDSSNPKSDVASYSSEILHETNRVATIVRNLLQFSRNENQQHSYSQIEDIINSTASLIKTVIQHDQITFETDIPKDLPKLKCRSQQIQQVIMNLLTNARDALNEKYQGYHEDKLLRISCKSYNKDNQKWIRVTIEDHGNGINKDIQFKIFDPFFTTKERDKGTGLGLSISYGIVKENHGELTFETKEGKYTKFYMDLPCDNG